MLIVKTPLRLSFFGGGSDIPSHFNDHGGATLSATFDKYVYASIIETPKDHIKVSYSETEYADNVDNIKHSIVRETLKYFGLGTGFEISSFADIPTVGTGLGASSAFCVSLIEAITELQNSKFDKQRAAAIAAEIEIDRCKSPIGFQDHIAATYGGINFVNYSINGNKVSSILGNTKELESCLFLVKMPERVISANEMLKDKMSASEISALADMAHYAKNNNLIFKVKEFGKLLGEAWKIKKTLHPNMSTEDINTAYNDGIKAGALGGKILGAGNGGYLLMCAESEQHKFYMEANTYSYTKCYDVKFTTNGANVVYDSRI